MNTLNIIRKIGPPKKRMCLTAGVVQLTAAAWPKARKMSRTT